MPGTSTLNKGGNDGVDAVSCASAGNCSAGGYYTDASGHTQAFVADPSGRNCCREARAGSRQWPWSPGLVIGRIDILD